MSARRVVWMVGTSPAGKGGIASVLVQYRDAGVFEGGDVRFEASHEDGGALGRVMPFARCALRFSTALLLGRVSLLHAHASHGGSFWRKFLLSLPAIAVRVPVLIHLHAGSYKEFYSRGSVWRRFCVRFLFRHAFKVVALSDEWRAWIISVEPLAAVEVLPNALSGATGHDAAGVFDPVPSVLFLGRIGKLKGTDDLLHAFVKVNAMFPQALLIVAGDGEHEAFLDMARQLGIGNSVTYAGWIGTAEKRKLLLACRVFALPSYHEGLPMAVLEAMAFSRPVISTPVGGIPQAVTHGQTGFLVKPGAIDDLAHCLCTLFADPALADRMGRAGRRSFEAGFSSEVILPRLFMLYRAAGVTALPILRNEG